MYRHCYCGKGVEISYKQRSQLLREFWAFCCGECLDSYLKGNRPPIKEVMSEHRLIHRSEMHPPVEYYDKVLQQLFRSKSESIFARWCCNNEIDWIYEPYTIRFDHTMSYTPDFYLPSFGTFVEVKGLWSGKAKAKLKRAQEFFSMVLVPDYLIRVLEREVKSGT